MLEQFWYFKFFLVFFGRNWNTSKIKGLALFHFWGETLKKPTLYISTRRFIESCSISFFNTIAALHLSIDRTLTPQQYLLFNSLTCFRKGRMVQGTCAECSAPTNRQCCCLTVFYCSQACQSTGWPEHRARCPVTKACKRLRFPYF